MSFATSRTDASVRGFFAFALLFTWAAGLPGLLAARGILDVPVEQLMPLAGLGAFGPTIAAVVYSRRESGNTRALWARVFDWRVPAPWFALALGLFPVLYFLAAVVYRVLGGAEAALFYPPENAAHGMALIIFPLAEEIGWRGFALPRLLPRYGAVKASLLVGAAWAAWHLMMFLFASSDPYTFALSVVNILVGSFVFTWFFTRTRGSGLLAILLHVGTHLSNPAHAVPNTTPLAIYTVAIAVAAVGLFVVDKKALATASR